MRIRFSDTRTSPVSIATVAARRIDRLLLLEIELGDCPLRLSGEALAQRLGQGIEPSRILGLQPDQGGDSGMPLLRSAGTADRLWAQLGRRTVAGLALAIASLALSPSQRALTLRLAAFPGATPGHSGGRVYFVT